MNHHQAAYAIKHGWPGVAFTLAGLDFAAMAWGGVDPKPTEADIQAVWVTVEQQWLDEQAAIAAARDAEAQRVAEIKADAQRQNILDKLRTATPAQINSYVDNNVTDLASAKVMLRGLILILASFVRQ